MDPALNSSSMELPLPPDYKLYRLLPGATYALITNAAPGVEQEQIEDRLRTLFAAQPADARPRLLLLSKHFMLLEVHEATLASPEGGP